MKKTIMLLMLLLPIACAAQSQGIDITILKDITAGRPQSLDHLFSLITKTAYPLVILIFLLCAIIGVVQKNNKLKLTAIQILAALIVTTILVVILKHAVGRPRPYITDPSLWHLGNKTNPSFPSGHSALTFVVATILSLNYRKNYLVIILFAWAILVAFSRLDLGMHYPSDVIAGAFTGFIVSCIVYKIFLRIKEKYASPQLQSKSA